MTIPARNMHQAHSARAHGPSSVVPPRSVHAPLVRRGRYAAAGHPHLAAHSRERDTDPACDKPSGDNSSLSSQTGSRVRRQLLLGAVSGLVATARPPCPCHAAENPPPPLITLPDIPHTTKKRWGWKDEIYAAAMATGMQSYEQAITPVKRQLFDRLASGVHTEGSTQGATLLELGIGTGPNLKYIGTAPWSAPLAQVVGLDPNPAMQPYTRKAAEAAGLRPEQLQLVQGEGSALPFADNSFDAAACTLVLCTVPDPVKAVSELHRVLKPGGQLLFIEHVGATWSQAPFTRLQQELLTPLQQALADGCTLTRDTKATLERAGFSKLDCTTDTIPGVWGLIAPHVYGIATK